MCALGEHMMTKGLGIHSFNCTVSLNNFRHWDIYFGGTLMLLMFLLDPSFLYTYVHIFFYLAFCHIFQTENTTSIVRQTPTVSHFLGHCGESLGLFPCAFGLMTECDACCSHCLSHSRSKLFVALTQAGICKCPVIGLTF